MFGSYRVSAAHALVALAMLGCIGCLRAPTASSTAPIDAEEWLDDWAEPLADAEATDAAAAELPETTPNETVDSGVDAAEGGAQDQAAADAGDDAGALDAAAEISDSAEPDEATQLDGHPTTDVAEVVDTTQDTALDSLADGPALTDAAADTLLDVLPDVVADALPDVEASVPDTAPDAQPVWIFDPTNYAPVITQASTDWLPPAGMQSSAAIACDPEAPGPGGHFVDVVTPAGIALDRPEIWPEGYVMAGFNVQDGGGQALGDFNGDGRLDLYFPVETGDDWLYLGHPSGPWKFKGFPVQTKGVEETSAVAADLDGDGDLDLVIGGHGVRMYRNDGPDPYHGVIFTDMTTKAGLDPYWNQPTYAAAVGDLDRDGWLDVLISPLRFELPSVAAAPTGEFSPILLRGLGGFAFENETELLPLPFLAPIYMTSLVDLDGDGDLDIYTGNDYGNVFGPNQVLRNDTPTPGAPLKLTNVSVLSGGDIGLNAMGIALGDFDRDGRMDLYFTGWENGTHLLRNTTLPGKKITFDDVGPQLGIVKTGPLYASWGAQFVDVDNDGWLDLLIPNGFLKSGDGGTNIVGIGVKDGGDVIVPDANPLSEIPFGSPKNQYDNLYKGAGDGTFVDMVQGSGFGNAGQGRALSIGDIDRDGYPEVVMGSVAGPPALYRNGCSAASWLHVRLAGKGGNRYGIGARVTVVAGGVTFIRDIEAGSTSLWCSSEPAAQFGLGKAAVATSLTVRWPSGKLQSFDDIPLRRRLVITEP